MSHPNALLTPKGRTLLARCIVEDGWPVRRAAERFQVSVSTAHRWAGRYREHGEAGMHDRPSRPHTSPRRTPTRTERRIIAIRFNRRWGPAMKAIAVEFDGYIRRLLDERRSAGREAPDDLTTRLLRERVHDRVMTDAELVSLLRNWTVGELSTIAASVGILVHKLATDASLTGQLREDPGLVGVANDEILLAHAPLIANRRVTTRDTQVSAYGIPSGERVTVVWASANRDETVFGDPDEIRLDRDPELNLLYGAGIHYCPGAPLARLELRVLVEELLKRTSSVEVVEGMEPTNAHFPGSGFSTLQLVIR